jgi:ADP-ribose pyrophosphatase YjhB (NUDIX family)
MRPVARSLIFASTFLLSSLHPKPRLLTSAFSLNPALRAGPIQRTPASIRSFSALRGDRFQIIDKPHNGCEIDLDGATSTATASNTDLVQLLSATVSHAREAGKSALWIDVPMTSAHLLPPLHSLDFKYHHATGDTASLFLWLESDVACRVPDYATTQVGVGALVVNAKNELLVVRELTQNYAKYKLPGGLADCGEHLSTAAIREVFEETGVECEFESVLAFRHSHGIQFGRGDIYFVCKLRVAREGQVPVAQAGEIESAQWIPIEEYERTVQVGGETPHPFMRHIMRTYRDGTEITPTFYPSVVPGRASSPIYSCLPATTRA